MTQEAVHVHRWVLEAAKTRDCPGRCECGAEKVFSGESAQSKWDAQRLKGVSQYSKPPREPWEVAADAVLASMRRSYGDSSDSYSW